MEDGGIGYRTMLLYDIEQSALDGLVSLEKEENTKALAQLGGLGSLATKIGVNLGMGLTKERVVMLREIFGRNEYPESPLVPYWTLLLDALSDTTLLVLLGAAAISLCIGIWQDGPEHGWVEGGSIFIAVFLVANISAGNDYSKQLQFIALENSAASDERASVLREGVIERIHTSDIVVGDVVVLQAGDQIPADCLLFDNNVIMCSQASLTGEAEDVKKSRDKDFAVYSSCLVTQADDKCLVLALGVGKFSQWGKIKANLVTESVNTPLQDKLEDMTTMIGYIGMVAAAGTFLAMIINIFAKPTESFPPSSKAILEGVVEAFILSVTIVVVAIPEGLPLAVTIALAYSTKKMYSEQCFIRVLAACETMGNATTICSDKTGTLTENQMTVVCGWFQGKQIEFEEFSMLNTTLDVAAKLSIVEHICTNRTSYLVLKSSDGKVLHRPSVIGNATEGALLLMVRGWGHDEEQVKSNVFDETRDKIFAFSSDKKRSTAVVTDTNDGTTRVFVKGASEWLLRDCTQFIDENGAVQLLTSEKRVELEHIIIDMADKALRTLLLAHVDFAPGQIESDWPNWRASPPDSAALILDCIVGIIDPLRGDVKEAVRIAQQAGVTVRMVTGDNIATASAIARQCGILTPEGLAMEGPSFRKLSPAQADSILPRLQVMARSSPDDKHLLVTRLNGHAIPLGQREWEERFAQFPNFKWATHRDLLLPGYREEWEAARPEGGQVVGVTGDGTNDAPALKAADVGLAMGITGTKVAQGAADIVILDDRFSSIVNAIKWGRAVYDNIRKFLQFQVTVNIVALLLVFFGAVCGFGQPLTAVQMLWVNLVMDTLGALALGTEAPTDALLMRKPYKRQASLISRPMWRNIACQAAYQLALLFALMFVGAEMFNVRDMSTHPCKLYALVKSASSSSTNYYIAAAAVSSSSSSSFSLLPLAHITCANFALDCRPLVSDTSKSNQDCFFAVHYASIDLPSTSNSSQSATKASDTFATFKYSELPDFEKKCLTCERKDFTHQTLIFNAFIFCQICNEYNARKLFDELNMFSGLQGNYMFLFVSLFSIGAQIMLVEVGGEIVSTTPLSLIQWLVTIGFGLLCLPVGVLMRLIPVDEDPTSFFGELRQEEAEEDAVALVRSPSSSINVATTPSSSSSLLVTHHSREVEMANKASTSYQRLDDSYELSP